VFFNKNKKVVTAEQSTSSRAMLFSHLRELKKETKLTHKKRKYVKFLAVLSLVLIMVTAGGVYTYLSLKGKITTPFNTQAGDVSLFENLESCTTTTPSNCKDLQADPVPGDKLRYIVGINNSSGKAVRGLDALSIVLNNTSLCLTNYTYLNGNPLKASTFDITGNSVESNEKIELYGCTINKLMIHLDPTKSFDSSETSIMEVALDFKIKPEADTFQSVQLNSEINLSLRDTNTFNNSSKFEINVVSGETQTNLLEKNIKIKECKSSYDKSIAGYGVLCKFALVKGSRFYVENESNVIMKIGGKAESNCDIDNINKELICKGFLKSSERKGEESISLSTSKFKIESITKVALQ
jgi:hypothetical protein